MPIFEVLGTDMHNHLLNGVDDGSKSIEESLSCIRTMSQLGYRRMYITPHFQPSHYANREEDIVSKYRLFKEQVEAEGIDIELVDVAGEYRIEDAFVARLGEGGFLKIGGHNLLVELSLRQPRDDVKETIFELQQMGYEVILAHPERYPYLGAKSKLLEELKDSGVYFQVNILSLSGFYGMMPSRVGYQLVERGWVEYLGTDMHNAIYADALKKASHSIKIQKMLEHYPFKNSEL